MATSVSLLDYIRGSLRQMHGWYDTAIADLDDGQLHWSANENGLPIAFVLWHYVRTEDNVVNFVLQGHPTIWVDGGWNERFGLHKAAQGTGMTHEDARNLKIEDKAAWQDYQSGVWAATESFLASLTEERLAESVTVKPVGEMPVYAAIGNMCLTHGYNHLVEIQHLRGLLGLRGMAW